VVAHQWWWMQTTTTKEDNEFKEVVEEKRETMSPQVGRTKGKNGTIDGVGAT
jgi:hypothetical protein